MIQRTAVTLFVAFGLVPAHAKPVDFQREIRPILSNSCFHCHGPDKGTRMVGLRLDTKDGAFAARKSGTPIVPGKASESLVYLRISNPDQAKRMPPEYSHKTLTPEQIDTIRRWIDEGATWKEHWAFVPPVKPAPPKVMRPLWVSNPIDAFILAELEKKGLAPAPRADKRTLIRRLSLDLTGLPPSPDEVEAFVKDTSPDAYEKLVDRLMATPQWGEHRARYWLDAARYGDTHGIHIDNYREIWPYRDWVIKAFNRNMPFDQFTIEQLAGDLLPNPNLDQLVATGFQRCNVTTNEGGVIPEEVAAIYAKDRADTTGTVFLGLTVGCATCHDHKFDPISQRDFYSMTAFYRNTVQDPLDGNISDTPPVIVVPRDEDRPRWQQLNDQEAKLKARMAKIRESSDAEFRDWLDEESRPKISFALEPADELLALSVKEKPELRVRNKDADLAPLATGFVGEGHLEGHKAFHFCGKESVELPNLEYFEADRPFTVALWFYVPDASKSDSSYVLVSQTDSRSRYRGWSLELSDGLPSLRLTTQDRRSAVIRAANTERLKPATWNHIAVAYDGSRYASGLALYVNGRSVPVESRADQDPFPGNFRSYVPLRVASDGKNGNFDGGAISELHIYTRAISEGESQLVAAWPVIEAARAKKTEELTDAERAALQLYFLNRDYSNYAEPAQQLQALREERKVIARRGAVTHVQQERTDQEPFAHVLNRGQYDQKRARVEPTVPTALPPMPASYPKNRLGLAKWLVDDSNPLTARVTVNRFWQEVFGTGLVKTTEDFGSQGESPSHPELLDWLAIEFRESGWDIKKLFRLMVTSSTYRQSALTTPLKLQKDPDNRLLSRGPRFRMDGEMVRDYVLAASGLLTPAIGGPSVKPYQPDGVWETVAMNESNTRFYQQDYGDKLYRRSMYTFWKRSAPPASMDIFNAPTRESCTVRRERTNTPLQALVTMNDPQFVEAARVLAENAIRGSGSAVDGELDFIAARVLCRPLGPKEREIVKGAQHGFLEYYEAHPDDARKLLAVGQAPVGGEASPPELAALTMVANQIFNLDEVLEK
jgi:hypothetical protein